MIDGETGYLCEPGDVEGFARCLLELLDAAELSVRMGTAGRVRAETLFAGDTQEKKILEIYKNMAG